MKIDGEQIRVLLLKHKDDVEGFIAELVELIEDYGTEQYRDGVNTEAYHAATMAYYD